jgi:hypothetical protein
MGMPKQSPSLTNNGVVVDIALASSYGALSYVSGSIGPPTSKLSNSMPVSKRKDSILINQQILLLIMVLIR